MRLGEFILCDMEPILAEWDKFATTLLPTAADMTPGALRDHARLILEAVANDLATFQTRQEEMEKSKGRCPEVVGAPDTAAQTHAVLRAQSGFDINQLIAEYRALRASVVRRWVASGESELEDVIRFNEAIDQAIAESVGEFHAQEQQARNLLLGMLGHDMRTPLASIAMTASYLATLDGAEEVVKAAQRLQRASSSIQALLDDLVDFNRTKFGLGVKVVQTDVDLAKELADEVEQLREANPHRQIEFAAAGDNRGRWDGGRMKQVVRNLVSNAIKYGSLDTAIRVDLRGEETEVWLEVANSGPVIDPAALSQIFDPLIRGSSQDGRHDAPDSLGLGLFIVREIVVAHGGEIEVRNEGGDTIFAVRLPCTRAEHRP